MMNLYYDTTRRPYGRTLEIFRKGDFIDKTLILLQFLRIIMNGGAVSEIFFFRVYTIRISLSTLFLREKFHLIFPMSALRLSFLEHQVGSTLGHFNSISI